MTALNTRSLPRLRCGFGYAFLEVCLRPAKPPFSPLRHALLNSLTVPSATISRAPLHQHLLRGWSLQVKTHS